MEEFDFDNHEMSTSIQTLRKKKSELDDETMHNRMREEHMNNKFRNEHNDDNTISPNNDNMLSHNNDNILSHNNDNILSHNNDNNYYNIRDKLYNDMNNKPIKKKTSKKKGDANMLSDNETYNNLFIFCFIFILVNNYSFHYYLITQQYSYYSIVIIKMLLFLLINFIYKKYIKKIDKFII